MKLKSVLDTLDGLDEALKPLYTERDGKFYLNVEGYDPNEVETMRTAMGRAKEEKSTAIRELKDLKEKYAGLPDDFTVDEYNRLKDSGSGNVDQRLATQRDQITKQKDIEIKKSNDERDLYKGMVTQMATDAAVNAALTESNITIPAYQNAARAMFGSKAKVDFEDGKPVVTIDNLPVAEKIKAYAVSEEGKYLVTAAGNGGGGSGNNQGSTVTDYSKMTFTELSGRAIKGDALAQKEIDRQTKIEPPKR